MIFIPALALIGLVVSATVYRLKASIICPGFTPIPASWKTSHGPAKSIMTAPSEITKATGILPSVGGFSELTGETAPFPSGTGSAIEIDFAMDSGMADAKLSAAAPFSNSLLFMAFILLASLRTRQGLRNCERDATPALALSLKLPSAGFCQPVILRAPVVLRLSPRRCHPAFLLHAVQCGKKRSGFDLKSSAGDLLNTSCNSQSMHLVESQRLQDEQVQTPLQQCSLFRRHVHAPIDVL